jgi:hypothetical protein
VFQPEVISNNEQCEGCPNCLSWCCHHQASSCTNFSSLQLGAGASSWKHPAIHGVSTVRHWMGSSGIRLQWTQKDRGFLRVRANKTVINPRQESRFRQLEPIKNKKGQKKNLRWDSRKEIPNELEGDKVYLKSLVLVRHLNFGAWKVDELGFGSERKLQQFERGKNGCWTDSAWGRWAFMVNF